MFFPGYAPPVYDTRLNCPVGVEVDQLNGVDGRKGQIGVFVIQKGVSNYERNARRDVTERAAPGKKVNNISPVQCSGALHKTATHSNGFRF